METKEYVKVLERLERAKMLTREERGYLNCYRVMNQQPEKQTTIPKAVKRGGRARLGRRRWKQSEYNILREQVVAGERVRKIAKLLGRTPAAVDSKIYFMKTHNGKGKV